MGRTSLKEIRQKEIIQVFYQVAVKEGLENTSIAKIANVLDINPSLIMHYFKTKEELTFALINYILDKYLLIYKNRQKGENLSENLLEVLDNLFSKRWNRLIDDSLFYSCYALTFRNNKVQDAFKNLLDALRHNLATLLEKCKEQNIIKIENSLQTADLIFVILDGAYCYLSLVGEEKLYQERMQYYKKQAIRLLNFTSNS